MRIVLSRIAGLVGLAALAAACSPSPSSSPDVRVAALTANNKAELSLNCTAGSIVMTMNPPTIVLDHTDSTHPATDVEWSVASGSDDVDFTIKPKSTTAWPLQDAPPYKANKKGKFHGKGQGSQLAGTYQYSISATCKGGPTVTFDPDIVVD